MWKRAGGEDAKKYPSEPDFDSEQEAMRKQIAKVAKRDEA